MKLREIDKSEIFDLIKSGKLIFLTVPLNIGKATLQDIACIKNLYTEDDQPEETTSSNNVTPTEATEAPSEPQEAPTVPDEEPTEEEPEPAPAPQEQSQAEPKRGPGRPSINKPQIVNYYLLGRQPAWIAQEMHCDLSTVYKTIKEHEEKQAAKRGQK